MASSSAPMSAEESKRPIRHGVETPLLPASIE
jgi:hypothetical protein